VTTFPPLIIAAIITVLGALFVLQPILTQRSRRAAVSASQLEHYERRAALLRERVETYRALSELEFEQRTDKVSSESYIAQRQVLIGKAIVILHELDSLSPEDDPFNQIVKRHAIQCTHCGTVLDADDEFCRKCGKAIEHA